MTISREADRTGSRRLSAAAAGAMFALILAATSRSFAEESGRFGVVLVDNPRYCGNEIFRVFEDYYSPQMHQLRTRYGLDAIVASETDEWKRIRRDRWLDEMGVSYCNGDRNRRNVVDRDRLEQTPRAYGKPQTLMAEGDLMLCEAMRLQLDADKALGLSNGDVAVEVSQGQWLKSVVSRLRDPHRIDAVRLSGRFKATLRPYQHHGVDWLCFLDGLQFEALLADDMGLGKTAELLAMLSARLEDKARRGPRTSLIVLPASLISNWTGEIERFLPSLRRFVAHPSGGADRKVLRDGPALDEVDLVITTYGLCQKYAWLEHVQWDLVILDEAQAIKNPGTQQTRAVKDLRVRDRIIMKGTPVAKRRQMIDRFQSDEYAPFMALSLKAGGVGLNLTAANHVVHFDRWWNPAVEDQTADRAFRIGQRKSVVVHRFVTKGTVEEKIDAILTEKTARVIDDAGLGEVFGIAMETAPVGQGDGSEAAIVEPAAAARTRGRARAKNVPKKRTVASPRKNVKKTRHATTSRGQIRDDRR